MHEISLNPAKCNMYSPVCTTLSAKLVLFCRVSMEILRTYGLSRYLKLRLVRLYFIKGWSVNRVLSTSASPCNSLSDLCSGW